MALLIGSLKDRAGSERVVVDSANYLSQFYDVYIFVCGDTRSKYIVDDSVDVISLTESIPNTKIGQLFWYVKYIRALRKKCKELDIELIISHWTKLSICLCFLNKNLITWAHEHQNDKLLPSWLIYLKRYVYPKLDYLTVLNKSEASISNELYNSNIGIIPGYVSEEFSHILCGEKKNQLLFIGRLVDENNHYCC
ncbi:glycosyltransferase [Photobacterium leiognathi]|uniref:glycosyltransferase n=1 Tax=Photobacterium leiognathi TaxID=553611 RepID=UPI000C3E1E09|nr:hypothetical protein CRG86_009680 [Photobacterium leiognathi]